MPYIKKEIRNALHNELMALAEALDTTIDRYPKDKNGIMTYIFYYLTKEYYFGGFDDFSDGVKVLECAKLEFVRRNLYPYEDMKIKENGDV